MHMLLKIPHICGKPGQMLLCPVFTKVLLISPKVLKMLLCLHSNTSEPTEIQNLPRCPCTPRCSTMQIRSPPSASIGEQLPLSSTEESKRLPTLYASTSRLPVVFMVTNIVNRSGPPSVRISTISIIVSPLIWTLLLPRRSLLIIASLLISLLLPVTYTSSTNKYLILSSRTPRRLGVTRCVHHHHMELDHFAMHDEPSHHHLLLFGGTTVTSLRHQIVWTSSCEPSGMVFIKATLATMRPLSLRTSSSTPNTSSGTVLLWFQT